MQTRAAFLSIISNFTLVVMKLVVGIITGSLSVISEAFHSAVDLLASFIAWLSIRESIKPPDEKHPYGHGKLENISGAIEAGLIFAAAVGIIYTSVGKFWHGVILESIDLGIAVMAVSMTANFFISRYLMRAAKKYDSMALEADSLHLKTDVYTSLGVLVGLVLVKVTGINLLDPIFAVGVALFIIKAAYDITRRSFMELIDERLPDEEIKKIERVISGYEKYRFMLGCHDLRSRKSGSHRHIDLHLVVCHNRTIKEIHDLCDRLEGDICNELPNSTVIIHPEPCGLDEKGCPPDCKVLVEGRNNL
ncbi:MAG: cation transporter [Deltaproteobacteria bacterium]|nr:cation transporter [Deltaproteobacteria bacterium]